MASIGLTVKDSSLGSNLGLGDILAQGLFSDPTAQAEAAAKAQAIGAQIRAHDAYVARQNAETGLVTTKTREEQDAEAERLRAGPLVGAAAAGAVPAPVPVEAPRPESFGGYGPQPGIIRPEDLAQAEALRARERALGPILVRGNPDQVASGVGKDYGGAILSGATINPAAVNPDALRIAGGLYTGTAPSTGTVWTGRDTAGQQAEAGKEIAVAAAKPPQSFDLNPKQPRAVIGADGKVHVLEGQPQPQPSGVYSGEAVGAQSLNIVSAIAARLADPAAPITADDARNYAIAYNEQFGPKRQTGKDPSGRDVIITVQGTPPEGMPTPAQVAAQVAARASGAAASAPVAQPAPAPVASPTPAPVAPPPGPPIASANVTPPAPTATAEPIPGAEGVPPPNEGQSKARSFASAAAQAEQQLSKIKPEDIPGTFQTYLATNTSPTFLASLAQSNMVDEKTRLWAVNMLQFTNAVNRQFSGAAITDEEWRTARQLFIPLPGDDPAVLARKRQARINAINTIADQGFSNDPQGRQQFNQMLGGQPPAASATAAAAPAVRPPNAPPEWDTLSDRGKALWMKLHGGGQ